VFGLALAISAPARAQECAHGPNEDPGQQARRRAALRTVRMINSVEAETQTKSGKYVPLDDLQIDLGKAAGFQPQFTTDGKHYALIFRDGQDPCSFAFSTNENGIIFHGYPIDRDVQAVTKQKP
jgi:hypothetical protein